MNIYYTQRADGRLYETETLAGAARLFCDNTGVKFVSLDDMPKEHGDKILILMAAGGDVNGIGTVTKSKQIYKSEETDDLDVEQVIHFTLFFDEAPNDTNRAVKHRRATCPLSII